MFTQARAVIGGESLTIGDGDAVSAVFGEISNSREYEDGGFDRMQSLTAVVSIADWQAAYPLASHSYLGKTATARGIVWRVEDVDPGQSFVEIQLSSPRKGK